MCVCVCAIVTACSAELPGPAGYGGRRFKRTAASGTFFFSNAKCKWVFHFLGAAPRQPSEALPHFAIDRAQSRTGPDQTGEGDWRRTCLTLSYYCCVVFRNRVCVHVIHVTNELLRVKVRQAHLDGSRVTNRSGVGMGAHGALFQPPSPSQWLEGHQSVRRGDGGSWSTFPTAKPISMVGGSPTAVGG